MTINANIRTVQYPGDGVSTLFAVPFQFFDPNEISVALRDIDGNEFFQGLTGAYTVAGGNGATGSVSMLAAPSAAYIVVIRGAMVVRQPLALPPGGTFPTAAMERELDREVIGIQEVAAGLAELRDRALKVAPGSMIPFLPSAVTRAGKLLGFDGVGNPSLTVIADTIASAANAAAAAAATLSGAMPKTAQTIHLSAFQWLGVTYSFRNDGVAVDVAAKAALRDLLLNSTSSFLEIVAPPGVINLGTVADGAGILIRRGGVVLRGAGKNATRFQYYSNFAVLPTPADAGGLAIFGGFGIAVGKFSTLTGSWTTLGEVSLRDFTLEDLNPTTLANPNYTTTNAPDGIFGYKVNDVDLQSVRVINAKGNGGITFNGDSTSSGPSTINFTARDCEIYGDGGAAGGFADGDGYNIGSYANVNILGGFVINVSRHAIEGGTPGASIVVDGVYINQGGNGFSGVNPTGYGSVRVVNCLIVSIHNGYHVDLTCDPGVPGANMRDITIANNIFNKGSGSSVSAIRLQTIGGTTSIIGRVDINGNTFDGAFYQPILIGANDAPSGIISGNDLSTCVSAQALIARISNSGASPVATDMLRVSGNILAPGVPIVKFAANVSEWQNTRFLRAEGNVRGRRLADAVGTEYGSLVLANAAAIGAAIPASSIAGPITLTIPDATPGDRVVFYLSPSWPVGPTAELVGYVTANNTVTVYVRNMTAAASAAIGAGNYFYVDVVRA